MRNFIALLVGKIIYKLMRLLGKNATALPGWWALKLSPTFLRQLRARVEGKIVLITGTNGKTTTANLLANIIDVAGLEVIYNQAGANMSSGLASTLVSAFDLSGKRKFNHAVLEIDEAFLPKLVDELQADYLLITNFFHDQVDRYGSIEALIESMAGALKQQSQLQLILNGDDPYSVALGAKMGAEASARLHYFAFAAGPYDRALKGVKDPQALAVQCPQCGEALEYECNHYAQLGSFACGYCALQSPAPDFKAELLSMDPDGLEIAINGTTVRSAYKGFYNAYNVAAAVSVAVALELPASAWQGGCAQSSLPAGRQENFAIDGQACVLSLYKNPAGLDQLLALIAEDESPKAILLALTDTAADGRDISWIWEAQAEILNCVQADLSRIICTGRRSGDLAVRMLHAQLAADKIEVVDDISAAVATLLQAPGDKKYLLATYAALAPVRAALLKHQAA